MDPSWRGIVQGIWKKHKSSYLQVAAGRATAPPMGSRLETGASNYSLNLKNSAFPLRGTKPYRTVNMHFSLTTTRRTIALLARLRRA